MRLYFAAAVLAASITPALAAIPQAQVDSDAFLATVDLVPADAAAVGARCEAAETLAKRLMADLAARTGTADIDGDFRSYDSLGNLVNAVGGTMYFIAQTNTAKPVRDAAQACSERMSAIGTDLSLSRPIYDRLSAIPTDGLDEATAFTLGKRLMQYRLAGVDRDAATRAKVGELNKQITNTGLAFDRNISEYQGDIVLDGADALAGMPQDYLDAHKPGADGKIHLTTAYPDVFPILEFADNRATRKAVYLAFLNRAYPANVEVLRKLIAERAELASTLGYANYAALITADKMIGTPAHARLPRRGQCGRFRGRRRRPGEAAGTAAADRAAGRVRRTLGFGLSRPPGAQGAVRRRQRAGAPVLHPRQGARRHLRPGARPVRRRHQAVEDGSLGAGRDRVGAA